ncbi:MAG: hypothetical protein ACREJD_02220 [Phycisphaerales bacterium]
MNSKSRFVFGLIVAAGSCVTALAGLSQLTLVSPGGFVQAGADPATSGGINWPGEDLDNAINGANSSFAEGFFAGIGTITRSASSSATGLSNSCHGVAGMGYVNFDAANSAPDIDPFPFAMMNGGWKETFTISNPAHTGESGFMQFTVHVSGFLKATGLTGSASIRVTGYKDNLQLQQNQFFSPGGSTPPLGSTAQYGNWAIATFGNPNVETMSVNDEATFAVPFTFGTPFTLGIYAWAGAGMRSSGGFGGTTSTALVQNAVVSWGGILAVYAGTTPVTAASTVTGSTGKDWGAGTQPPDPCPGDFNNDGVVDDADFVIFVSSYNILDCADPAMADGCPGDMNSDGFVDDADFVEFVVAYNNLTCV